MGETTFALSELVPGPSISWKSAFDGSAVGVDSDGQGRAVVPAHGVQVYLYGGALVGPTLLARVDQAMAKRLGKHR